MGDAVRRPARLVSFVLATLLALGVVVSDRAEAARPLERRLLRLINDARVERGRPRLEPRAWLTRTARRHSREMAAAGTWFHNTDLAAQLWNRPWSVLGENVGRAPTVYRMHRWFTRSASHRHNILNRAFDRAGVGIYRARGYLWVTEVFIG